MGVTAASVRQMLGSADKAATFRLLETLLKGNVAETLAEIRKQYSDGSDPLLVVQDSLEIIHLITRVKVAPVALADITLSEHDRASARHLADCLSMPVLARLWQMLLKGVTEIRQAPSPLSALEMLMVRIAYAAQMPTPAEVIRNATNTDPSPSSVGTVPTPAAPAAPQPNGSRTNALGSFAEAVALFKEHREVLLALQLNQEVRPVHFEPGLIELSPVTTLPRDFISKVAALLTAWTGQKWRVQLSDKEGRPSLHEEEMARKEKQIQEVSSHPLVSSVLEQFPGAKLVDVKTGT
jgi:DNA polymerase-3 subunit gamma/tau